MGYSFRFAVVEAVESRANGVEERHLALGTPPAVRPVGANSTMVEDGKRGVLASTEDECMGDLDRRPSWARSKMGLDVRGAVTRDYSPNVQGPCVAAIMQETAAEARP